MNNDKDLLVQFNITELEDRLEFGICGGGDGGGDGGGGPGGDSCDGSRDDCEEK